jgi:hypothetical protein
MKAAFLFCLLVASAVAAQQPAATSAPAVTGQVSGRVICGDTDAPARFASVQLVPEKPSTAPPFDPSQLGKNADFGKIMSVAMKSVMSGSNLSTLAGIDGSYTLDKIPPGTYYVIAQFPGYQSPLAQLSAMERMGPDAATMKEVEDAAQKIVVQPSQAAHADLRLERGATLSGTIRYDDGSPAPGVTPVLMEQSSDGKWKELSGSLIPVPSDDRGHYRFYGLAAGKYAVKAALPTVQASTGLGTGPGMVSLHMNTGDALVVFSGGVLREKDIKPVEVGKGDDTDGVDVVFPLSDLHVVSGTVEAKSDGHPVNSGNLSLLDSDTKSVVRTAMVDRDGNFRFNYVPDGQYILKVSGAADLETPAGEPSNNLERLMDSKRLKSYGSAEQPLMLKDDATGLVLQVPDTGTARPSASN